LQEQQVVAVEVDRIEGEGCAFCQDIGKGKRARTPCSLPLSSLSTACSSRAQAISSTGRGNELYLALRPATACSRAAT
jgi:hypothetical protein